VSITTGLQTGRLKGVDNNEPGRLETDRDPGGTTALASSSSACAWASAKAVRLSGGDGGGTSVVVEFGVVGLVTGDVVSVVVGRVLWRGATVVVVMPTVSIGAECVTSAGFVAPQPIKRRVTVIANKPAAQRMPLRRFNRAIWFHLERKSDANRGGTGALPQIS
jgi:hypothetical protein